MVLDVPPPVADQIMAVRKKHCDELRSALPVEITVAGSTGIGVVEVGQDPAYVFSLLDRIAADTAPIRATFGPVFRVPNSDISVLTLTDEAPFRILHARIATSGIRFRPMPIPFAPHCTLRSRYPISDEAVADLLGLRIAEPFLLTTLTVYMLDRLSCTLLHLPCEGTVPSGPTPWCHADGEL